jgi:pimeloyl-ACP methyl ester carboxylesterase
MQSAFAYPRLVLIQVLLIALALGLASPAFAERGKAAVGDIEIAYRIRGDGEPLLMIMGYGGTMDDWDPTLLGALERHYRVITFDNRGIGGTSAGTKPFTIDQFAEDTAGLLAALDIGQANILGWSMGSHIAQELALKNPQRVGKMVLYATQCGGKEAVQNPGTLSAFTDYSGGPIARGRRLLNLILPPDWVKQHKLYLASIFIHPFERASREAVERQYQANKAWKGTCDRLGAIKTPTFVVAGTDDQATPPANALIVAERIQDAWLAYFRGGGHGLMYQYPEAFAASIGSFLEAP